MYIETRDNRSKRLNQHIHFALHEHSDEFTQTREDTINESGVSGGGVWWWWGELCEGWAEVSAVVHQVTKCLIEAQSWRVDGRHEEEAVKQVRIVTFVWSDAEGIQSFQQCSEQTVPPLLE